MSAVLIHGMHGLGDNLHQRAIIRQLMQSHDVWLESSWVAPYHDLISDGLKVIRKATSLRTQTKNARREAKSFAREHPPSDAEEVSVWYRPDEVRAAGSVLGAMCVNTGCDYATTDFRLPVPQDWRDRALKIIGGLPQKPIMVYRPLVERTEWNGCAARNPNHDDYLDLFLALRDRYHVISVADLVPNVEWIAGHRVSVDQRFHFGELEFEALAGLFSMAGMVFCSPGFAVILAQAVGTPVACVFGGYERAYSFSAGARYSPYLGIEPMQPCDDFRHDTRNDKRIDLGRAIPALREFSDLALTRSAAA